MVGEGPGSRGQVGRTGVSGVKGSTDWSEGRSEGQNRLDGKERVCKRGRSRHRVNRKRSVEST